jgi:hypothetical protein
LAVDLLFHTPTLPYSHTPILPYSHTPLPAGRQAYLYLVYFLKINIFTHFGRAGFRSVRVIGSAGIPLVLIRGVFCAGIRPAACLIELPADMCRCPEKGNKKSSDKPVQNVSQYKKDENIHGRQIYYRTLKIPVKKRQ